MENEIKLKKLEILENTLSSYLSMQDYWIKTWGNMSKSIQEKIDDTLNRIEAIKDLSDKIETIK